MAEQEELTLVVNLTDTASAGLAKLRQELAKIGGEAKQVGQEFRGGRGGFGGLGESARRARRDVQELGSATTTLHVDRLRRTFDGLNRGSVRPLTQAFSGLSTGFSTAARLGGVFTAALGAIGGAAFAANKSMSDFNDQMVRWSQLRNQTGLPIGTLRNMANQMREVGLSTEQAESALSGLSAGMARFRRDRQGMEAEIRAAAGHEKFATLQKGLQELFDTKKPEDFANKIIEIGEAIRASAPTGERGADAQKKWLAFFGAEALQNFRGRFKEATEEQKRLQDELAARAETYQRITSQIAANWQKISDILGALSIDKFKPILDAMERASDRFAKALETWSKIGAKTPEVPGSEKPALPQGPSWPSFKFQPTLRPGSLLDEMFGDKPGAIGGSEATPGLGGGAGDDLLENTDETKENTDQLRTLNEFYTRLFAEGGGPAGRAIRLAALGGGGGFGTGAGTGGSAGTGMGGAGVGRSPGGGVGSSPSIPQQAPGTSAPSAGGGRGGVEVSPEAPTGKLADVPGYSAIAEQRQKYIDQLNSDPGLRRDFFKAMQLEEARGTPRAAAMETIFNRMEMTGQTNISKELHSGFYGPVNRGRLRESLTEADRRAGEQALGVVGRGSNLTQGRTDQGMVGDPNAMGPGRIRVPGTSGIFNYWKGRRGGRTFSHEDSRRFAEQQNELARRGQAGPVTGRPQDALQPGWRSNVPMELHPGLGPQSRLGGNTQLAGLSERGGTQISPLGQAQRDYFRKLRQPGGRANEFPYNPMTGEKTYQDYPSTPDPTGPPRTSDEGLRMQEARLRLDRAQANSMTHTVNGTGKITVDVNAPRGTKVGAEGGGLFKEIEVNRNMQMVPATGGRTEAFA